MKNNFVLVGEEKNFFLINFLEKKEVFFSKYSENQDYEAGEVFFFSFSTSKDAEKKKIDRINKLNKEIYIVLPHHLRGCFVNEIHKKIYYPVEISIFKNFIKTIFNKKEAFGDILIKGNYIENTNSRTRAYLTETQINILKILISGNKVEKDKIKKDVLKIINSLDTKSLESHFSRIRKKLTEIDSKTTITSVDINCVKLIDPGVDH